MDNAEECQHRADSRAKSRKLSFVVNQESQHTAPQKSRNDKTVAEHRQCLIHDLQTHRKLFRRSAHRAHELAKNYQHERGDNRQNAQTHRRRMSGRRIFVCLTDDFKTDEDKNRRDDRPRNETDKERK